MGKIKNHPSQKTRSFYMENPHLKYEDKKPQNQRPQIHNLIYEKIVTELPGRCYL